MSAATLEPLLEFLEEAMVGGVSGTREEMYHPSATGFLLYFVPGFCLVSDLCSALVGGGA